MSVADDFVAALAPWMTPDLETYARAIGGMFAEVEMWAEDSPTLPGWGILLDVNTCPAKALPYLAMYVGERLPAGITEAAAREWIRDAPNQVRGTPYSIFRAAQRYLTGQRTVQIIEREPSGGTTQTWTAATVGGTWAAVGTTYATWAQVLRGSSDDPDRITVITYADETPNQAQVLAELRTVVPADIVLNYQLLTGQRWVDVAGAYATWAAVKAANLTWDDVRGVRVGSNVYTRPKP